MIELRPATPDDGAVVAQIYIESWNEGFGDLLGRRELDDAQAHRWAGAFDTSAAWTVAELDGVVTGFVGVCASRDPVREGLGELETIAVDPTAWRRGVGRALMGRALDQLREQWTEAILWTPAHYERGHGFYRSMGWDELGLARRDGTEVAFGRSL